MTNTCESALVPPCYPQQLHPTVGLTTQTQQQYNHHDRDNNSLTPQRGTAPQSFPPALFPAVSCQVSSAPQMIEMTSGIIPMQEGAHSRRTEHKIFDGSELVGNDSTIRSSSHQRSTSHRGLSQIFISGLCVCVILSLCLYGFYFGSYILTEHFPASILLSYFDILCPLSSLLLYVSPIASVAKAAFEKEKKALPVRMFIVQGIANVLAIDYGIKAKHPPFYLTNMAGLCIQLFWVAMYNYICLARRPTVNTSYECSPTSAQQKSADFGQKRETQEKGSKGGVLHSFMAVKGNQIGGGAKTLQSMWWHLWSSEDGTGWMSFIATAVCLISAMLYISSCFGMEVIGIACTLSNLMLFSVPLAGLGKMIRTRNADNLPLSIVVMMVVANATWGIYGNILKDPVVYVPSLIGFLLCVFQLLVVLWCRRLLVRWIDFAELFYTIFRSSSKTRGGTKSWKDSEDYYDAPSGTRDDDIVSQETFRNSGSASAGRYVQPVAV
eukprot:GHVQ01023448.1.p1 GENE.GHVQ01023448.1~~GHVQ01023448.1.p1  ORF type:complete len:495 (+),score=53.72 GHVQ01023448.1:746-2230(+)